MESPTEIPVIIFRAVRVLPSCVCRACVCVYCCGKFNVMPCRAGVTVANRVGDAVGAFAFVMKAAWNNKAKELAAFELTKAW